MSKEAEFVKAYKKSGKGQSRPESRKKNIQGEGDVSSLKRRGEPVYHSTKATEQMRAGGACGGSILSIKDRGSKKGSSK